jgi:hypothetical protein
LIFRNSNFVPLKIEIIAKKETKLKEIIEKLALKTKNAYSNFEMVMIKNHEIIEYVSEQKDVSYIRRHEGFLFCFEKYAYPLFYDDLNKIYQIHCEV